MDEKKRRKELGLFLRTRREQLSHEEYGFDSSTIRRTKGLRREEVAMLTGISLTWYTWLEQGRDIQVSTQVLDCISRIFKLNSIEQMHLFELAGHKYIASFDISEQIPESLQKVLNSFDFCPAYITNESFDIIAWNEEAVSLFGDFSLMSSLERNNLWRMFTWIEYRSLFTNWNELAQELLAQFRVEYGKHVDYPKFQELVKVLMDESKEFKQWWSSYNLSGNKSGLKLVSHPTAGDFSLQHNSFIVADSPGLSMTVYVPVTERDLDKIKELNNSN